MKLSILEYMNYLGGSTNSKCVVEGENVLNAGHLILAGKIKETSDWIDVYGLCLQSSSLESHPHEITGKLLIMNTVKVDKLLCSCKAGNSGKCKHISAFLIKCIREDVELLEKVSQTDKKCIWSTQKYEMKEKYRPVSVDEMPCLKNKVHHDNTAVDSDDVRNFFCNKLPVSAITKHRQGRRGTPKMALNASPQTNICANFTADILNNAYQSPLMMHLASVYIPIPRACCTQFLSNLDNEDIEVAINIPQGSGDWKKLRKYRITGSRCYEIYTYKKDDWKNKAVKYFNPSFINNKYIKHGIKYENSARDVFIQISKMEVVECGLVISSANKWLGYSPDGIIFFNNQPLYLLEIKCIFEGKTKTILETLPNLKYIVKENEVYKLKKNHKYYGQIQMGMAVLNLQKAYFVIYASYDNSLLIVEVDFDYEFTFEMLSVIKHNYLDRMLHVACT